MGPDWSDAERRWAERAVGRKRVYFGLSAVGLAVGVALAAYYLARALREPDYPLGVRLVLVLLILLNARQNLRQYRFARLLERLGRG